MSDDYKNSKQPTELTDTITSLRAGLTASQQKKASFDEESYRELLAKYETALKVIETLKTKIDGLESKKLPNKDEVESMSAVLDLFGKLDPDTLDKLERFGKKS